MAFFIELIEVFDPLGEDSLPLKLEIGGIKSASWNLPCRNLLFIRNGKGRGYKDGSGQMK